MTLYFTEYEVYGRWVPGPLIEADDEREAQAFCDYLRAPDGAGALPRVLYEVAFAEPGPKERSKPLVTCLVCRRRCQVILGPDFAGSYPTVCYHEEPWCSELREKVARPNRDVRPDKKCEGSGRYVIVKPDLMAQLRLLQNYPGFTLEEIRRDQQRMAEARLEVERRRAEQEALPETSAAPEDDSAA